MCLAFLLSVPWLSLIVCTSVERPMMKVGMESWCDGVVIVVKTVDDNCTSWDGCSNHAARKIEKKVIIKRFLYFLLVVEASGSFDLESQGILLFVGVVRVILVGRT